MHLRFIATLAQLVLSVIVATLAPSFAFGAVAGPQPAPAAIELQFSAPQALQARFGANVDGLAPNQGPGSLVSAQTVGGALFVAQGCAGVGDAWIDPGEGLDIAVDGTELGGRQALAAILDFVPKAAAVVRVQLFSGSTRVGEVVINTAAADSVGSYGMGAAFRADVAGSQPFSSVRVRVVSGQAALCGDSQGKAGEVRLFDPAHRLWLDPKTVGPRFFYKTFEQKISGNLNNWGATNPGLLTSTAATPAQPSPTFPSWSAARRRLGVIQSGEVGLAADSISEGEVLEVRLGALGARSGLGMRWIHFSPKSLPAEPTGNIVVEFLNGSEVVGVAKVPSTNGVWRTVGAGGELFNGARFSTTGGAVFGLGGLDFALEPFIGPECFAVAECDDGNACTAQTCTAGACVWTPVNLGSLTCGEGACKKTVPVCAGGVLQVCDPLGGAQAETCNGIDDDCDGEIDENWPELGKACTAGQGPCEKSGQVVCAPKGLEAVCSAIPLAPAAPTDKECNGIDDDCDGEIDEDFAGELTTCGVGRCAGTLGVTACVNGEVINTCDPFASAAAKDANCDGIDDDCDGQTDEDFVGKADSCGAGVCANTGVVICVNGEISTSCVPLPSQVVQESDCDGLDNDCDGSIDEGFVGSNHICGVGVCRNKGATYCKDGAVLDSCQPGQPISSNDATCDGLDDDCDGTIDEDCPSPGCKFGIQICPIPTPTEAPDVGKPACKSPTSEVCTFFNANVVSFSQFVGYSNGPGGMQLPTDPLYGGNADWACFQYIATSCNSCMFPNLDYCKNPGPSFFTACGQVAISYCDDIQALACPAVTLQKCGQALFYNNGPLINVYDEACTSYVQGGCNAIFHAACPATQTLDHCAPWVDDIMAVQPPECRGHVSRQCTPKVQNLCPSASIAFCLGVEAGTQTVHPACESVVATRCANWRDNLCPSTLGLPLNAQSCATQFAALVPASTPAVCAEWAQSQCGTTVVTTAQVNFNAAYTLGNACFNETLEEGAELSYSLLDSVSEKSEFDCYPTEALPEPPHDQNFDLNPIEGFFAALSVASLQQQVAGLSVRSCEEYVKQKYWQHEIFKAFTFIFKDDARRVWQAAYTTNPAWKPYAIARRVLDATWFMKPFGHFPSGVPFLTQLFPLAPPSEAIQPKNIYAAIQWYHPEAYQRLMNYAARGPAPAGPFGTYTPIQLAMIEMTQAALDNLAADMDGLEFYWQRERSYGPNSGWHWHHRMSAHLRDLGVSDEELMFQYRLRQRFIRLLDEYDALERDVERLFVVCTAVGNVCVNSGITENSPQVVALRARQVAIIEDVHDLLFAAQRAGCFEQATNAQGQRLPSVCDWAPADFVDEVNVEFTSAIDRDLRECTQRAPADFTVLAGGYSYLEKVGGVISQQFANHDPASQVSLFETYLKRMKDTKELQGEFFANLPPNQRPTYGQSWSDASSAGNPSYFQIGYSIGAGWRLDVPEVEINICELEASAWGYLNSGFTILNNPFNLIDTAVTADTETATYATHFSILGIDLWQEGGVGVGPTIPNLNYQLNLVYDGEQIEETAEDSFSTPVFNFAGFNIMLRAGYVGKAALDTGAFLRFGANFNGQNCSTGLDLAMGYHIRPSLQFDGFLEAGLDLWIVEFGVGGSLNLISLSLPIEVSIGAQAAANLQASSANLQVATKADLSISTLSGKLYFYAKTFWKTYRKTFFDWEGYSFTYDLLRKNFNMNLGLSAAYCLAFECYE